MTKLREPRHRRPWAAATALVAALCCAAPATTPGADHRPLATQGRTMNWGGYVVEDSGHTTVTATWVNPQVDCTVRNIASFWVGLDGWRGSPTVEQTGVDANCRDGVLRYRPWFQMFPHDSQWFDDVIAAPGDTMTATVTRTGPTSYLLAIADKTRHWTKSLPTNEPEAKNNSAEVIVEPIGASSTLADLPDFDTVQFTRARVDGRPLADWSPTRSTLLRDGLPLADTGDLDGDAFAMTWRHR